MADVNPVVIVAGEVRQVVQKRDFVDTVTAEVTPKSGRTVSVLTYGGFLKLSVPQKFDDVPFEEGQIILVKADVLPWTMPKRDGSGTLHGTAFIYTAPLLGEELEAVVSTAGLVGAKG